MSRHPWKTCDVEGFFLLFTENMMFVLMVSSSLLGSFYVIIMYFLTRFACSFTHWFTIPYYSKIYSLQHVLAYIRYLVFPLFVTPKLFYPSAKVVALWQPVTGSSQVVYNQRPLLSTCVSTVKAPVII